MYHNAAVLSMGQKVVEMMVNCLNLQLPTNYGFEGYTVCIEVLLPCVLLKGRLNLFACTVLDICTQRTSNKSHTYVEISALLYFKFTVYTITPQPKKN